MRNSKRVRKPAPADRKTPNSALAGRVFRFVVEDAVNALRDAEAFVLTSIEAVEAEKPHIATVLRRGANEITAVIGELDHAVNNARLVGANLIVPARDGGAAP